MGNNTETFLLGMLITVVVVILFVAWLNCQMSQPLPLRGVTGYTSNPTNRLVRPTVPLTKVVDTEVDV